MNSNSFPRNTTVQLSNDQARFAIELRKSFPLFAKNAKGGERGGLFIYLDEQNNSIKIGATKQSFINVVVHSITQWYKDNSKPKSIPSTKKPASKPTNSFSALEEKEPDTHITLFGCRVPLDSKKKGLKWHIGHTSFEDEKDDSSLVKDVIQFSKVTKNFPSLGKPVKANHNWNGSTKVMEGEGLINPPRPDGWFGLQDIYDNCQKMAENARVEKTNARVEQRRAMAEATDELGNIVDLEEYLKTQADDDRHDDDDDSWDDLDDNYHDDFDHQYYNDWDME